MVYFDSERSYQFRVEREVIAAKAPPNVQLSESFCFDTFAEAFKFYKDMYRMDKACWEMLKDDYMNKGIADESKHADNYSFSLCGRYLSVKLVNLTDVAREAFALEKGKSYGG